MAADGSIGITPGTGRSVRTIEGVGVDSADQQVGKQRDSSASCNVCLRSSRRIACPVSSDSGISTMPVSSARVITCDTDV